MAWLIIVCGALLMAGGAFSLLMGFDIVMTERGAAMAIGGVVALSGGTVALGIGFALFRMQQLLRALQERSIRPGRGDPGDRPVVPIVREAPVLAADQPRRPAEAGEEAHDMGRMAGAAAAAAGAATVAASAYPRAAARGADADDIDPHGSADAAPDVRSPGRLSLPIDLELELSRALADAEPAASAERNFAAGLSEVLARPRPAEVRPDPVEPKPASSPPAAGSVAESVAEPIAGRNLGPILEPEQEPDLQPDPEPAVAASSAEGDEAGGDSGGNDADPAEDSAEPQSDDGMDAAMEAEADTAADAPGTPAAAPVTPPASVAETADLLPWMRSSALPPIVVEPPPAPPEQTADEDLPVALDAGDGPEAKENDPKDADRAMAETVRSILAIPDTAAPAAPAQPAADDPEMEPAGSGRPAIVGTYQVRDRVYNMFADGSVEAVTETGVERFDSLDDLRRHLDRT